MKKISLFLLVSLAVFSCKTSKIQGTNAEQDIDKIINATEVERIERVLSADDMEGRKTFSRGIEKAGAFIADEFKNIGLQTFNNSGTYMQNFAMTSPKLISISGTIDGVPVDTKNAVVVTTKTDFSINEKSGFETVIMPAGANFTIEARKYLGSGKRYFVVVDTSFAKSFGNLTRFKSQLYTTQSDVVFVLAAKAPATYTVMAKHEFTEPKQLANVVGVIPGKSRKNEYVIISGHYDHLGIRGGKDAQGNPVKDSIFNGANDDAAGTTAVIMLAKYFKALHNNERTLIFVAFTAEEIGGFGSNYFSRQVDPETVMAMFNIEMIGTESKWGRNSAYITGYEKTDMGTILQSNLNGTGFTFYPDPYIKESLFYRSDNATLARQGVPAHTISTSKMDSEPNYHKVSDEISTLDMANMAMIIKAVALSSKGIISGKQTPSRVNTNDLTR